MVSIVCQANSRAGRAIALGSRFLRNRNAGLSRWGATLRYSGYKSICAGVWGAWEVPEFPGVQLSPNESPLKRPLNQIGQVKEQCESSVEATDIGEKRLVDVNHAINALICERLI